MPHATGLHSSPGLVDIDRTFLPLHQMRQISRVTSLEGATIQAEVELGPDHWVWPQHFPGDPIFPGSLMVEAAGQLIALWAWSQGARGRPRLVRTSAEFQNPVGCWSPALVLTGEVRKKRHLYFGTVEISSEGIHVARLEGVLAVLP